MFKFSNIIFKRPAVNYCISCDNDDHDGTSTVVKKKKKKRSVFTRKRTMRFNGVNVSNSRVSRIRYPSKALKIASHYHLCFSDAVRSLQFTPYISVLIYLILRQYHCSEIRQKKKKKITTARRFRFVFCDEIAFSADQKCRRPCNQFEPAAGTFYARDTTTPPPLLSRIYYT